MVVSDGYDHFTKLIVLYCNVIFYSELKINIETIKICWDKLIG